MHHPIALTALGCSLFTSALAAQEIIPASSTPSVTPVTAVDRSANPPKETPEAAPIPVLELDPQVVVEDVVVSDDIPLPVGAEYEASDAGDVLIREASGDPFFIGFAGGKHHPPATEILDPLMVQAAAFNDLDARGEAITYGFVMFSKRITKERVAELEELGVRVLGFHPHYAMRVAMPVDVAGTVSTLDFVRWVGAAQPSQKLHPALGAELAKSPAGEPARLYVSVFESDMNEASSFTEIGRVDVTGPSSVDNPDARLTRVWQSNGWMHQALAELGAEIESYAPRLHTFQVVIDPSRIDELAARDFVQFIEPVPTAELMAQPHDESRAMIASDRTINSYDGGTNQVAIVGVVDSGIETAHSDLNISGVGWNCTTQSSAWNDIAGTTGTGHGTHVAGSILGRGVAEGDQKGNAPGLASWGGTSRLFNYRRFPNPCSVALDSITSTFGNTYTDGAGAITQRPHIVNNSWGTTISGVPVGTEFNARAADDAVFDQDQLWVWSAGNSGPGASTLGIESSAKNVFTVGSVIDYIDPIGDPGTLWTSSSRGPTDDNRWKPNISAPGRWIRSAVSNNNTGYASYSGTSMAAPHVTAAAAMIVDRSSTYRYAPERLMSLLMASATTKDNITLTTEGSTHLDTYGAGRVNSFKSSFNFGGNTFSNWGFELNGNQQTGADFTVPAGTTRIVVVMAGIEESAGAGASAALVNDYDLWIDRAPIDPAGNTGEYSAQQSTVDNCEIRMISSPAPGQWRWKVYPDGATSRTKLSVTVYYVADDTTPDGTLTLTAGDSYIKPNEVVDVTARVDADDYVASAVVLDRSGSFATVQGASTVLGDGTVTDLTDNPSAGSDIVLGDVIDFYSRSGVWDVSYASQGTKTFTVNARSDNMVNKAASVNIVVDGTMPGAVSNLSSPSHTVNQWSNDPTIQWTWTAATDSLSGLQGYGLFETTSASIPGPFMDIGPATFFTSGAYPSSTVGRYFNIRSVDRSDNWDNDFVSAGPYFIDTTAPSAPTSLATTTHPTGTARCEPTVTVRFTGASDAHSGIDGYSILWSTSATSTPNTTINQTSTTATRFLGVAAWYLHVRTIDNAGNASGTAHFGPFIRTATCGTEYCFSNPNSSGTAARISATGTDRRASNNLTLNARNLPTNTLGYFLISPTSGFTANPAGSQGNLCLSGGIGRYSSSVQNSGGGGMFSLLLNLASVPTPTGNTSVAVGSSWHVQAWFRDANPSVTTNFTSGLRVTFY